MKKWEGNERARDVDGRIQVDWYTDFYFPLLQKWADRVRSTAQPDKIVLCEPIPNEVRNPRDILSCRAD